MTCIDLYGLEERLLKDEPNRNGRWSNEFALCHDDDYSGSVFTSQRSAPELEIPDPGTFTLGDGEVIEKGKEYATEVFIYPSGETFYGKYAGQSMRNSMAEFTCGINYSKYDVCRAALAMRIGSGYQIKEVLCLYHNTPASPQGLVTAAGVMAGISSRNIETMKNGVDTFQSKCHDAGIRGTLVANGHSLGVPANEIIFGSRSFSDPMQIGVKVNFGGPTQPPGAINYVAATDIIPWVNPINLVHAVITGFEDITFINSFGQSPLGAHSFLGPSYQKALRDSINNRGLYNE